MPGLDRNETQPLHPITDLPGPTLTFDFPGFSIGVAEYAEGPTGCTVFHFPAGAATVIDTRGGSVGKAGDYEWNHAICFAGGSLYGLAAVAGVAEELFRRNEKPLELFNLVSGAIIYDFWKRNNLIYPDAALARAALAAARPGIFLLGRRGAGRSAGVGGVFDLAKSEASGQAGAFNQVGLTKLAVFTVVNALGVIVDRQGQIVRGNRDQTTGQRTTPREELQGRIERGESTSVSDGNTTLTLVVTNQRLPRRELTQFSRQVHSSMARVIQPFHTIMDGDILYAVTTNEVENPAITPVALGMLASEMLWDAILDMTAIVAGSEGTER